MKSSLGFRWTIAFACAALAFGCAPGKTLKKSSSGQAQAPAGEAGQPGVESGEANIRGSEFTQVPELQAVHFDYDAYALQDDARAALQKNAEYLKQHRDLEILVAGNCDDRGTTEYNLALGQKRAKEVREYYIRLGIPSKAVATISYGEEKPACTEATESCWHRNRRADTKVRALAAASNRSEQ